jgi:hypothetical protein
VQDPTHWDAVIPTQAGTNKVESVTCANLMGRTTLQAMVTVRSNGSSALLDIYVYDKITDPQPSKIFSLMGMQMGKAKISGYNTLLTCEVDSKSSVNINAGSNAALVTDLCREFKWSDATGTLVPIAFPGLFPDLTRFQAEDDQQKVNQGQGDVWKLSATQTAKQLAMTLLQWQDTTTTSVVSGGGKTDTDAVVKVSIPGQASGMIQVMLARLEGNANGGIWIVTDVASSAGTLITAPQLHALLSSPTAVTGQGNAFEAVIGTVTVLDHTYTDIGHTQAKGAIGMGKTTFSTNVTYSTTFKTGAEEGIVALYVPSNAGSGIATAVLVKVLLS